MSYVQVTPCKMESASISSVQPSNARWIKYYKRQHIIGKKRTVGRESNEYQIKATLQAIHDVLNSLPVGVHGSESARIQLLFLHLRADIHVLLYERHSMEERQKTTDASTDARLSTIVQMLKRDVLEDPELNSVAGANNIKILKRGDASVVNKTKCRSTSLVVSGSAIKCLTKRTVEALRIYEECRKK